MLVMYPRLIHTLEPEPVRKFADHLYPYYLNFSLSFCQEKDSMNNDFRAFVDSYIKITSRKLTYMDLSVPSLLVLPIWEHTFRFMNHYTLIPWLPEPKLYAIQGRAEIKYQATLLVNNLQARLDKIDSDASTMRHLHDMSFLLVPLLAAITAIEDHQRELMRAIEKLKPKRSLHILLSWVSSDSTEAQELHRYYARSERILQRLRVLMEALVVYRDATGKLQSELSQFRTSLNLDISFEISPTGQMAIPPIVEKTLGPSSFFWLNGRNSDYRDCTGNIPSIIDYHYHLDKVNASDISDMRSALLQLCEMRTNVHIVSGSLYMICTLWNYALTVSSFDDGLFNGVQRSWVLERREAIDRFRKKIGTDEEHVASDIASALKAYDQGTPIPEYLH